MTWHENLRKLKSLSGMTTEELARASGISKPSLEKIFSGATRNPGVITVKQLVHAMGYSLGDVDEEKAPGISPEAMKVAVDYDGLPPWGQRWVRNTIRDVQETMEELAKPEPPMEELEEEPAMKVVPLFQPFAAGPAEPDWDNPPGEYEVPLGSPADFAITVNGTSMEPYLPDQSVQLGSFRTPGNGDVGAFVLGGEYLVKQYFRDDMGNVYLLSLNRAEDDKDVTLWAANAEFRQLTVLGTIIMAERPPLPKI